MNVKVRVKHKANNHTVWVEPAGWEPDVSQFGEDAVFDGAVWTKDDDEVAGMAITLADVGTNDPTEGEQYEVKITDLFWLSSGDTRYIGLVKMD